MKGTPETNKEVQLEHAHNIFQQSAGKESGIECQDDKSLVVARFLEDIQQKFGFGLSPDEIQQKFGFGQQHMLEKA